MVCYAAGSSPAEKRYPDHIGISLLGFDHVDHPHLPRIRQLERAVREPFVEEPDPPGERAGRCRLALEGVSLDRTTSKQYLQYPGRLYTTAREDRRFFFGVAATF
jgi:hypothetical protein